MAVENLTSLISALRSETANASITPERLGSLLQKIVDAIKTTSDGNINIVCQAVNDELRVKGASALVEAGFVPVIFRYSCKSNHLTDYKDKVKKFRGPKKRGWNILFSTKFAQVESKDTISFSGRGDKGDLTHVYSTSPWNLLHIRTMLTANGDVQSVKVAWGKRTINAAKGRRFKFGIGFAKPNADNTFNPKNLVTNIAPFMVYVRAEINRGKTTVGFCI